MIATAVGSVFCRDRIIVHLNARTRLALAVIPVAGLLLGGRGISFAQTQDLPPAAAGSVVPAGSPSAAAVPADTSGPIAFVPLDNNPDVKGAIEVSSGKAVIGKSGTVTSGSKTTQITLPRRGVLRVCASTSVHLSADASVPANETPGLMMALDHGALEASFATGQNSDTVLTPDFRILIGGPGSSEVKVRLGQHGDTCVDNPGGNAPYVVVSSVFEGGAYRVQPGQRVMFQHGSLKEVVDQEKEPCGCPPEARPGTNDFPLAQSAGLVPLEKAAPTLQTGTSAGNRPQQELDQPLVYTAPASVPEPSPRPALTPPAAPPPSASAVIPVQEKKKPGFFRGIGRFFKKIFGAE